MGVDYRERMLPDENRRVVGSVQVGTKRLEVSAMDGNVRIRARSDGGMNHFVSLPQARVPELVALLEQAVKEHANA